jgi:hypothetical protein
MLDTLVLETSRGEVVFELAPRVAGFRSANIGLLDQRGVAAASSHWVDSDGNPLSDAIVEAAGLSVHEAQELAERVISAWETGPEVLTRRQRITVLLTPVFLLLLVPLSVLWILVWLVLQLT